MKTKQEILQEFEDKFCFIDFEKQPKLFTNTDQTKEIKAWMVDTIDATEERVRGEDYKIAMNEMQNYTSTLEHMLDKHGNWHQALSDYYQILRKNLIKAFNLNKKGGS